ncbi:MAG: phytochelatin synthase family protein [Candidatus Competibacteraceae bacterium]|nr:phytochelatin synthase family protein [Candidatus Competibacteraceae bacterium]
MILKSVRNTLAAAALAFATLPCLAAEPIYFNQPESAALFASAELKDDYWSLAHYFVSERYLTYCGIASSVMTLNSLGVKSPVAPLLYPYQIFTEENIFTEDALKIKPVSTIEREGLTLPELSQLLALYASEVQHTFAADSSVEEFRQVALATLQDPNKRLIINYLRTAVEQVGGGHISPIAAYDEASDRFLMLDVARYKYPPSWITASDMFNSMLPHDSDGESRGYVVVSK